MEVTTLGVTVTTALGRGFQNKILNGELRCIAWSPESDTGIFSETLPLHGHLSNNSSPESSYGHFSFLLS